MNPQDALIKARETVYTALEPSPSDFGVVTSGTAVLETGFGGEYSVWQGVEFDMANRGCFSSIYMDSDREDVETSQLGFPHIVSYDEQFDPNLGTVTFDFQDSGTWISHPHAVLQKCSFTPELGRWRDYAMVFPSKGMPYALEGTARILPTRNRPVWRWIDDDIPTVKIQEAYVTESSSPRIEPQSQLHPEVTNIMGVVFSLGADEVFEPGFETPFSESLQEAILNYGHRALSITEDRLDSGEMTLELMGETIRWLGYLDDSKSQNWRRRLIEKYLKHASFNVRYSALMGISFIKDVRSIDALDEALASEKSSALPKQINRIKELIVRSSLCPIS